MFCVPIYFQVTQRVSNTEAGAHLFPAVAGNAIGGIISGLLIKKYNTKRKKVYPGNETDIATGSEDTNGCSTSPPSPPRSPTPCSFSAGMEIQIGWRHSTSCLGEFQFFLPFSLLVAYTVLLVQRFWYGCRSECSLHGPASGGGTTTDCACHLNTISVL